MPYDPQVWATGPSGGTPISAARLTHIENGIDTLDAEKIPVTEKGAANGVATLGADSKLPGAQVPDLAYSAINTPPRLWRVGEYHAPGSNSAGPITLTRNWYVCSPISLPFGWTIDSLTVEVTTGGAAGAVLRLGVYDNLSATDFWPGALLVDAGTAAATTTGNKEVTFTAVTSAYRTGVVWLVTCLQVADGVAVRGGSGGLADLGMSSPVAGSAIQSSVARSIRDQTGSTGALLANFRAPGTGGVVVGAADHARLAVRRAA